MFDFGLRLRQLREQQKLSQEQLGKRIGRSKSVICSYENNIKVPPLAVLTKMAVVFRVSLDYLVGIDKEEMIAIDGLSLQQKALLKTVLAEFKEPSGKGDGLSIRQQEILNGLMREFAKRQ